jgi:hypothetical protein
MDGKSKTKEMKWGFETSLSKAAFTSAIPEPYPMTITALESLHQLEKLTQQVTNESKTK